MLKIKKGDLVIAVAGRNKGRKGKVLKVFPSQRRVLVEGVNIVKKTTRPSQRNPQGGLISQEIPFDVSNVMLFCSRCSRGTRFKAELLKDGSKIRVCKGCGEKI